MRQWLVRVVLATVLVVAGCGSGPDGDGQPDPPGHADAPSTSPPDQDVTVLAGDDPVTLAVQASQALYDQAPVVVLVPAADPDSTPAAAEAVELGVPLLVAPADPPPGSPAAGQDEEPAAAELAAELDRLGVTAAIAHGEPAEQWARQLPGPVEVVPAGTDPPPVAAAEPLASVTMLAGGADHDLAPAAAAEAAGARVLRTAATDPRADPALIEALAESPPTHTVAVGGGFGPADRLADRLAVATTGVQLPGGGQVLFPGRRLVALYGHPGSEVLGALGEQPLDQALARAQAVASEYEPFVDEPVVPTFEIITTIASAGPGPAGDYSRRTPIDQLRPWVEAAAEAGGYVVLDLQPGHTDFLTQAKEYEELLLEPHVGLALDPEWRLAPDQRHMVNVGQVAASEVNQVVDWLADLTSSHQLPQKLLILHQFQVRMITERDKVDTNRDEVAVLIHADGFGNRAQKLATWDALHAGAPDGAWWGWKNFYDEDQPTFTPEQTVAVPPSPVFISYQ